MDLTIKTKQYEFTACSDIAYIDIFLTNKTNRSPSVDSYYNLTKKEVQELIRYLLKEKYTEDHWLIDRLSNMEMLMEGKDKASFHFW